jgi:hypothetical protein
MNFRKIIGAVAVAGVVGASTLGVGIATANAQPPLQPSTTVVHSESAGWHGGGHWHGWGHRRWGGWHGVPWWHAWGGHPWGWGW